MVDRRKAYIAERTRILVTTDINNGILNIRDTTFAVLVHYVIPPIEEGQSIFPNEVYLTSFRDSQLYRMTTLLPGDSIYIEDLGSLNPIPQPVGQNFYPYLGLVTQDPVYGVNQSVIVDVTYFNLLEGNAP